MKVKVTRIKTPVTQPVGDAKIFGRMANVFWKTCIAEGVTPMEFAKKGIVPRPDDHETFLLLMAMGFKPEAAKGLHTVLQFDFTGEVPGSCHVAIDDGRIETAVGGHASPNLTIEVPFECWMDVITGKMSGESVFMERKAKAEGDPSVLMRLKDLFGGSDRPVTG